MALRASEGLATVEGSVGNGPTGVAVNSQNTVYVTNSQANTLTVIAADGTTNTIAGTTNTITGATNINVSTAAATNINTGTSSGNVVVGNRANTTTIQSATNTIDGVTNNMFASSVNSIQAPLNNIGTVGASVNNIGNSGTTTQVNAQGGNAKMTLANNSAQLTVPNAAAQNNGVAVDNTKASMTGGTSSATRLSLNDTAATFSRVSTGAPITVTGVADGSSDYDAVNVRQFAGAVAAVSAQANVPALAAGQTKSIGLGLGNFMGRTGLAMGMNIRGENNATYKLSVSSGLNGGAKTVVGAGAAWAF